MTECERRLMRPNMSWRVMRVLLSLRVMRSHALRLVPRTYAYPITKRRACASKTRLEHAFRVWMMHCGTAGFHARPLSYRAYVRLSIDSDRAEH